MRVAYLITAYRDLVHLERLCAALEREDPSAVVLVQFDSGSPLAERATALDVRVTLTRRPVRWGDGSYVLALLDSLRMLMADEWDWVLVLSGQDYPLRPLGELHEQLEAADHSAYSPASGRLPDDAPPAELVERYTYRYRWAHRPWPTALRGLARRTGPIVSAVSRGLLRIQPRPRGDGPGIGVRRRTTIFSDARPCYMGSDYVAMRRAACAELLARLDQEPEVVEYFAESFVPSEALFASVLRWNDPEKVANRNFHFMRFSGRANPRLLSPEDLPELWTLGAVFGRKFDDDTTWAEEKLPMRSQPDVT
jgi:hypothetical protein